MECKHLFILYNEFTYLGGKKPVWILSVCFCVYVDKLTVNYVISKIQLS